MSSDLHPTVYQCGDDIKLGSWRYCYWQHKAEVWCCLSACSIL